MADYRKATIADKDEILDLINYVFSFDHCPHDFKQRDPKRYGGDYPFWEEHYVAEEHGKLLATLSVTKRDWHGLYCGHVGQVCVHPYHRGRGFMKTLMNMAIHDMEQAGFVFAELNGLRQRYEYFGFTQGGVRYRCTVIPTNLRHKHVVIEPALALLPAGNGAFTVQKNGEMAGILTPYQISLENEKDLPAVLQLFFEKTGQKEYQCTVPLYDQQRLKILTAFCEEIVMEQSMQYRVFRFQELITKSLEQRADLWDGSISLSPKGQQPFRVTVNQGKVFAQNIPHDSPQVDPMTLQTWLLGLVPPSLLPADLAKTNWFPLSL